MFEWPPNLDLFFGLVAFLAASVAVRGWRDLAIFLLLTALLTMPVKWTGTALGLTLFAGDIFVVTDAPQKLKVKLESVAALVGALILAALAMIAWKEIRARQSPRSGVS